MKITFIFIVANSFSHQAILLATVLMGVRNEPQGPAYLPPSPRPGGGGGTGHPDEWAGVSMYLHISPERLPAKKCNSP